MLKKIQIILATILWWFLGGLFTSVALYFLINEPISQTLTCYKQNETCFLNNNYTWTSRLVGKFPFPTPENISTSVEYYARGRTYYLLQIHSNNTMVSMRGFDMYSEVSYSAKLLKAYVKEPKENEFIIQTNSGYSWIPILVVTLIMGVFFIFTPVYSYLYRGKQKKTTSAN